MDLKKHRVDFHFMMSLKMQSLWLYTQKTLLCDAMAKEMLILAA